MARRCRDRTLLLIADQGFGDVIQFARYIPWAAERCPDIAIACSAEMQPLLRQIAPARGSSFAGRMRPTTRHSARCPACRGWPARALDTSPRRCPYLRADPARAAQWAERMDGLGAARLSPRRRDLGRPADAQQRPQPLGAARRFPAARRTWPASRCWRCRRARRPARPARYYGRAPLINIGAEIDDYDDTMAILDNLDLLVTVDTSVAHLAGAMGRPVWIMLPRAPDWRWLLDRSDTPWYPSARLFRQQTVRRWDDVAQAIAAELAVWTWPDKRPPAPRRRQVSAMPA